MCRQSLPHPASCSTRAGEPRAHALPGDLPRGGAAAASGQAGGSYGSYGSATGAEHQAQQHLLLQRAGAPPTETAPSMPYPALTLP